MTPRQVISLDDLPNARPSGMWIRSGCPIHGSNRQRSLAIRNDESEYRGFGRCHACEAQVLVRELNPEAAARFEAGVAGAGRYAAPEPVAALKRRIIQARPAGPAAQPQPEQWHRDELRALQDLAERMAKRLEDDRPAAYLAERGIPLDVAQACGLGYIPPDARLAGTALAAKWRDRIIIPLSSPAGQGYIGRSLHGWQPGMDELEHKHMLEAPDRDPDDKKAWGGRWEKTNPAGWFGYSGMPEYSHVVIVEGAFDALSLIAAGLMPGQVVALAGLAMSEDWLPPTVRGVVLALDADERGRAKARDLAARLEHVWPWPKVDPNPVPAIGKDWSEAWRLAGWEGVAPAIDALGELELKGEAPAPVLDLEAEARADPIVCDLLQLGYSLVEVRAAA